MRTNTILLLVFLIGGAASTSAQTTITGSFLHNGIVRDYRLYIPAIYNPANPVPLVFNLHGYTSDNLQQELYGDFRAIADTANFLVVHPNGTLDLQGNRFWNTFGVSAVDDLGFLSALLDTISTQYSIDADRVYSTGMSNGGFMSYDLACFRSERFAAIASVTGSMLLSRFTSCAATHPTPVMQIHGTADGTVNYNGGSGIAGIEELVNYWVQFNSCSPTAAFTPVPDVNTTDGCTAEHYVYTGGDAGSTVEFFKILGGGHTWPGAVFQIGVTNQDFSASKEIWRFFSQYRLGELQNGITEQRGDDIPFTIGPNPSSDVFHLRFTNAAARTITVVNATGQLVMEVRSAAEEVIVPVSGPGLFILTVLEGTRRVARRSIRM